MNILASTQETMPPQLSFPGPSADPLPIRADLDVESIAKWLKMLHLGNPVEAAHCIAERLQALNQARLDGERRMQLTELYRPASVQVLDHLEQGLGKASLPLNSRLRSAAKAGHELLRQQAYAYKLVLRATVERHDRAVVRPLLLAMQYLARMLVLSYKIYSPARKGVWLQLHRLHQLAVERGCANAALDGETPSRLYKNALLLAFADPSRLVHGDVDRVREYLDRHCDLAKFLPLATRFERDGRFLIHPGEDRPGRALNGLDQLHAEHGDHLFSSMRLADKLIEQLGRLKAGAGTQELGLPAADAAFIDVMQRLVRQWGAVPKRQFSRLRTRAKVEICVGLRGIWQFLKAGSVLSDSLDFIGQADTAGPSEWMVANEGAGGFALMHVSGTVQAVHVGEVAALRSKDRHAWHICVVRWVMSDNPEHLEMGLQVVAPDATPASIMQPHAAASDPALMLPGIPSLKQAPAILAAPGHFKKQCELLIERGGSELSVRATRMVEQTLSVELFQFNPL